MQAQVLRKLGAKKGMATYYLAYGHLLIKPGWSEMSRGTNAWLWPHERVRISVKTVGEVMITSQGHRSFEWSFWGQRVISFLVVFNLKLRFSFRFMTTFVSRCTFILGLKCMWELKWCCGWKVSQADLVCSLSESLAIRDGASMTSTLSASASPILVSLSFPTVMILPWSPSVTQ